MKGVSGVFK